MIFDDRTIGVWAYNIETVLAEKYETILRRGELSTRPRDFYDIYILAKTQDFDEEVFADAVKKTSANRGTTHILKDVEKRIASIGSSEDLKRQWKKYTRNYRYAEDIPYDYIIEALKRLALNV
ncbi:nucleotidyl transferase AbiEii/AbiGii toxin family protein [Serpentinicella alkaliphila]|uniref:Nucleotidyltransferase AbiEii toxin of type IV toxin-antitoxin system n=1 Tax=Serpentinicella alkaliphila TaxID=1734049 RepID=A0A4V2T2K8_9FIRM|nr:nucleotidyl transferase AbiEii/AbiGii toxin family protein [Serpentinicella alkaliphila]TCP97853.1 nucleotidyltransferase AbiEii toxin of type IV toxin-antitoxin system [Serpentinicella alkaliphila]